MVFEFIFVKIHYIYIYIYVYHSKIAEKETRYQIEELITNELPTKEALIETTIEEEEVKPKLENNKSKAT